MTDQPKNFSEISVQVTDHPDGRVSVTCDSLTWQLLGAIILDWYDCGRDPSIAEITTLMRLSPATIGRISVFIDQTDHMAATRNATMRAQ